MKTSANLREGLRMLTSILVGGQTLGSVTIFLGRNHMNLFRKFDVFDVVDCP